MPVLEADVAEILSRSLIDNPKKNSQSDVKNQAPADHFSGTVFLAELPAPRGLRILRLVRGRAAHSVDRALPCGRTTAGGRQRDARATCFVFLVVKPNEAVILQVMVNRQNCDDGDGLVRHWCEQDHPVHGNGCREKKILR